MVDALRFKVVSLRADGALDLGFVINHLLFDGHVQYFLNNLLERLLLLIVTRVVF